MALISENTVQSPAYRSGLAIAAKFPAYPAVGFGPCGATWTSPPIIGPKHCIHLIVQEFI